MVVRLFEALQVLHFDNCHATWVLRNGNAIPRNVVASQLVRNVGNEQNSGANFSQRLNGRVLHICIGAADVRFAAVLIVGEFAVAHQVECPHWAIFRALKPRLDVFGVGGAVARCVHEFACYMRID
ncbi:unannotated protein [freshwater metagenome]|uniref:Unannotated protein n=1 Tax=freshwater metagenome TaxID=449393 RepID=A0A6J6KTY7_9ZZZZ